MIICLENVLTLAPIPPNSCRLVLLHYIVIQGTVHDLPVINVLDVDSNDEFVLKKVREYEVRKTVTLTQSNT
jgi:hypothetical protein